MAFLSSRVIACPLTLRGGPLTMTLDLWSDFRLRSRLVRVELGEVRVSAEVEPWWDAIPPSVMAIWACCKWCPAKKQWKKI